MPPLPFFGRYHGVMKPVSKRPASIERYHAVGGVLDIRIFEEAEGNEDEILDAIGQTLGVADYRPEALRGIGGRRTDEAGMFGSWFDPATGRLVSPRRRPLRDGRMPTDVPIVTLTDAEFGRMGASVAEPGTGGELAYAFTYPPYGLHAPPMEIQSLFDALRHAILPRHHRSFIIDWTSPRLPEVSAAYFEPGMEWWGVFLFSIHIPETQHLTIIAGSATD